MVKKLKYTYTIRRKETLQIKLLQPDIDYKGADISDELKARDLECVLLMREELKKIMNKKYIPKFKTMHEEKGVSVDDIKDLVQYAVYYEIERMDDSKKTSRFLYRNMNTSKDVKTTDKFGFQLGIPGSSYKEQIFLKYKIEYKARLHKANNPNVTKEDMHRYMKGLKKGIDYSEEDQPVPPYKMDLESRVERAMATSSCKQAKEYEDKKPNKVIRQEVKALYGTNSTIPADNLQKAAMRRRPRYNGRLAEFVKKWTPEPEGENQNCDNTKTPNGSTQASS